MAMWPFDAHVARNQWTTIVADGFAAPVPGVVYDGHRLDSGVPMGGLGTGYFTLEGTGKIGLCSIFNDIVPPRRDFKEWLQVQVNNHYSVPLSTADIAYWGHFPVADMYCTFDNQPFTVGIRAVTPLILGDAVASNIPATLFEIEISNTSDQPLDIALVITPPQSKNSKAAQVTLYGDGVVVTADDGPLTGRIACPLAPHQTQRVRVVLAWYAPHWRDSGNEAHVHQYGMRYASVQAVASDAWQRFSELTTRVLAWQRVIYTSGMPDWLCDGLVQSLYSLAKNSIWIAKTRKDEWWGAEGWFTHNESHLGCPITETMVCRMHGHFPILFFYPELEAGVLAAFRHFQIADGEIPFSYGGGTSMRDPRYHCQHPLNPGQYAQQVYRLFARTNDRVQLSQFYASAKAAIRYQYTLDDDDDGLVNDQAHVQPGQLWPANQFYDIWPWWGTSAYVAGTWLATLRAGQALATAMGDSAFADECTQWLARGQAAYQEKLWTGEYYRLWHDPANTSGEGTHSDVSLGNQLMAQWCVKVAGLADVLPSVQVDSALHAVARLNMQSTIHGLVNGATATGQRYDSRDRTKTSIFEVTIDPETDFAKQIFVAENLCAAMTFIYHGQAETGLEIARRIYAAVAITSRSPWNQWCLINAETGLPVWGEDYYSNMVMWALPMALGNQGVGEFVQGEFVQSLLHPVS